MAVPQGLALEVVFSFFVPNGKFIIKETAENKSFFCSSTTGIYSQANSLHFLQLKADIFNTLLALHVQVSGSGSVPLNTPGYSKTQLRTVLEWVSHD